MTLTFTDNENDKEFITALYEKYYDFMISIACKYIKDIYSAEDIVNTAVFRIHKNIQKIRSLGVGKERVCLSYIIKSEALDYIKKSKTLQFTEVYEENIESKEVSDSVETQYFDKAEIKYDELHKYMYMLKERDRDLLVYKYFMQYSERKIAEIMGISERNVATYMTRAKRRLLKLMGNPV